MSYIATLLLMIFSFTVSASDWPECFSDANCPTGYSCKGTGHNNRCVADPIPEPMSCSRSSDCPEGYQCPRCWGEQCFICTKKPTSVTTEPTCPTGTVMSCRPVWREPGIDCSCRPKT